MAERIVVRQNGRLCELVAPRGTKREVGACSDGLILEEHDSPSAELPDIQFVTHMVGIGQPFVPFSFSWREGGVEKAAIVKPGSLFLNTAGLQRGVRWNGRLQVAVLSISIPTMEQALPEPFARSPIELISLKAAEPDLILQHLLAALRAAFERNDCSETLLLESLGNAISLYLAQKYALSPPPCPVYKSGLSSERMSRLIDYIEAHLDQNLSVVQLSRVACLSPYHCGRMFKRSMGCSLHQYVSARRIERAKSLLRLNRDSLSEIALSVGFQDQSQFTTAFKQHLQITPARYRRNVGIKANAFDMP